MKKKRVFILGLIVLVGAISFGAVRWLRMARKQVEFVREIYDCKYLAGALISFAETHRGRLPQDWDELTHSDLASVLEENKYGLHIPGVSYRMMQTKSSWDIRDRRRYRICFGLVPESIRIEGTNVLDVNGHPVKLIAPSGESLIGDSFYANWSLHLAETMKESAGIPETKAQGTKPARSHTQPSLETAETRDTNCIVDER